ncbi:MAG: polyprenyl synthetase family protein [Phycisphaerales bacterium]
MHPASERLPAVPASMAGLLDEVGRAFERQLSSDMPSVNTLCRHVERYRGKMLRPMMVFMCGQAFGDVGRSHVIVAATCEMIHMATLVHDDVLDEAEVRRRGHTVNHLRGNEVAVMLGDYLISNAFHLCSQAGDPALNLRLGEVTNTLCEGELVQLSHRDDLSLDEPTYFEIVRRKTAVLIGACCELGAMLSGAPRPAVDALRRFGEGLGVAFQIQDDLLDLEGREEVVGKSLGRDLEKGKLTLPLIIHLARPDGEARERAIAAIRARDGASLIAELSREGSLAAARRRAEELVARARAELSHVPAGAARDALDAAALAVVHRDF